MSIDTKPYDSKAGFIKRLTSKSADRSLERARERPAAQQLHGVWALIDQVRELGHDLAIEILARDISRPGMNGNLGGLQVRLEREAAEHRQTPEQGTDAVLDDRLDPLAPHLLLPVLQGFHGDTVRAGCVRDISPQRVLSRDQLIDLSRLHNDDVFNRAIDVQIMRLRRKLEGGSAQPRYIKTERGAGYVFGIPVETVY